MNVWAMRASDYCHDYFAYAIVPDAYRTESDTKSKITLEWEPGSDTVADFMFLGSNLVVKESIAEELKSRFSGFEIQSVEMIQNPRLKQPKRITKRTKPRIWLPYNGPRLVGIRPTVSAKADPARWPILHTGPDECWAPDGLECRRHDDLRYMSAESGPREEHRVPRDPSKGYFISRDQLAEIDIFRVFDYGMRMSDGTCQLTSVDRWRKEEGIDFTGHIFCNDSVKEFLESRNYSNLTFFDWGEEY